MCAYEQAIEDGANYIECDVVLTKDLVPVCLHEYWLDLTTDVADRIEFADRRQNFTDPISGETIDNWFTFNFTLVELKTLKKKQVRLHIN